MEINIYLLQRPRIEIDGREAFVKLSSKALALVFYLAAKQGEVVSRETLSNLFWPQQQEENARSNLRQSLSYIKKTSTEELGEEVSILSSDRSGCSLNENLHITVDLTRFHSCLSAGYTAETVTARIAGLQEAADLYRDGVLSGIFVRGSASFEEWLMFEREYINQTLIKACRRLAALYREEGRLEKSIACLQKILQIDPLLEAVHLELMKIFCENRERTKAVLQYKECARILGEELNISPMEETRDFFRQISEENAGAVMEEEKEASSATLQREPASDGIPGYRTLYLETKMEEPADYEGIYRMLEPVICGGGAVPTFLKRGLAILFPQYSEGLDGQQLSDMYLYYTIRKLLEELSRDELIIIWVQPKDRLDRKSRQLLDYLTSSTELPGVEFREK